MAFVARDYVSYTTAPTALDADGICAAQQLAGAGDLTINGALASGGVATFGEQQRVTLASSGNLSARTFTIYGTTTIGDVISEAIAGPNNNTVTTTANFKTVTQIAVDGAVGTNMTAGVSNALETPWIGLNIMRTFKGVSVELTGATLTYEVQYGSRKRLSTSDPETAVFAIADATLTAENATAAVAVSVPWPLIRLKITGFSAGTATLRVVEGY